MELFRGRKQLILVFMLLLLFLYAGGAVILEYVFMLICFIFLADLYLIKQKEKKEKQMQEMVSRFKSQENLNVENQYGGEV